jgi:hypothetical protein
MQDQDMESAPTGANLNGPSGDCDLRGCFAVRATALAEKPLAATFPILAKASPPTASLPLGRLHGHPTRPEDMCPLATDRGD